MYLMRGDTNRTKALMFNIRHRTAARNKEFEGWHKLEMFLAPPNDRHRHYVAVPAFWQNLDAHRTLCVR